MCMDNIYIRTLRVCEDEHTLSYKTLAESLNVCEMYIRIVVCMRRTAKCDRGVEAMLRCEFVQNFADTSLLRHIGYRKPSDGNAGHAKHAVLKDLLLSSRLHVEHRN